MQPETQPDGRFDGQVAVVTGGGSGIGFAIAQRLVALGASVVLAGRRPETLRQAADRLGQPDRVCTVPMDVRDPDQAEALMARATTAFGRLDMLVNAAAGNFRVHAEDLSVNGWRAVTEIVLNGTWFCTQAAGRRMIAAGTGSIVNIGTVGAFHGGPLAVHSASAKGAVLALTRTLAVEWARHGIRVNLLTPGATADTGAVGQLFPNDNDQQRVRAAIPLGRFARREEIAGAAAFLLGEQAAYITGENLVIDGGKWLGRGHLDHDRNHH